MSPGDRLGEALKALADGLADSQRPAMIIGGIAAIAYGVARLTRDIDATVLGEGTDLSELLHTLARHAIEPRIAGALEFVQRHDVLLLRHEPTGVDVDLSIARLPFEEQALATASSAVVRGATLRLVRAEDLVVYKIVAWRPQDQQDVERLIALHGDHMDLRRVRALASDVATALEEPERLAQVEEIIGRTRSR